MVERNGDLEERCVNKEGLETRLNSSTLAIFMFLEFKLLNA